MPCKRHRTCPCLLQATPGHPFYILNDDGTRSHDELGQGWIRAKDLKAGDIILLLDGTRATIESVAHEQLDEPVKTYNFEVEDFHTYFVGHDGWLVHNECHTPGQQTLCAWGKDYERRGGIPASDVQAYYDLCAEYGYRCSIHAGHPGTKWNFIHMHFGESRTHLAIIY